MSGTPFSLALVFETQSFLDIGQLPALYRVFDGRKLNRADGRHRYDYQHCA